MPEGFGQTLETKAGPLPVWAWAGIGTVGLAGFLYYRNKKNAAAQSDSNNQGLSGTGSSSNLGTTPVSNLTTDAQPMPIQMGDTFVNVDTTSTDTDGDDDNRKPMPPVITPKPNPAPKPAPKPVPPVPAKPPAAKLPPAAKPAPPKTPAKQTTYTIVKGDTLWGIATKFYGSGALWPQIYKANQAKIGANPNLIHPGTVLVIPPK